MDADLTLREAVAGDVPGLMSWFDSVQACRQWGGPHTRYPATADEFAADAKLHELASFTLLDAGGRPVAFGQWYERAGHAHLGRLAVAPRVRGQRIGAALIRALLRKVQAAHDYRCTSLFVFPSNRSALRCYRALGYAQQPLPGHAPPLEDLLYFTAPIAVVLGERPGR